MLYVIIISYINKSKTMRRIVLYFFILCYLYTTVLAEISSKHSISILNTTSTRDISLMRSSFLIGNDSSALFVNSASLMNVIRDSVNFNYTLPYNFENEYILNTSYAHINNDFALGVGFALELDKVNIYDGIGNKNKDSFYGNYLINLGFAYSIVNDSSIGVNIKTVVNNLDTTTKVGAFLDLSYMQSIFTPAVKIGFGIRNFGFYDNTFSLIDTDIISSIAYTKEDGSISITAQYYISVPSISHNASIGVEAMILDFNKLGITDNYAFNDDLPESALDIQTKRNKRRSTLLPSGILARFGVGTEGVSLGLGVYINLFRIDYAIVFDSFSKNNISHNFSLGFMF